MQPFPFFMSKYAIIVKNAERGFYEVQNWTNIR